MDTARTPTGSSSSHIEQFQAIGASSSRSIVEELADASSNDQTPRGPQPRYQTQVDNNTGGAAVPDPAPVESAGAEDDSPPLPSRIPLAGSRGSAIPFRTDGDDVFSTNTLDLAKHRLGRVFQAPPYGVRKRTSLLEILEMPLPNHPDFYIPNERAISGLPQDSGKPHVLTNTKDISDRALQYPPHQRLKRVVWSGDILKPFVKKAKEQTKNVWFSWAQVLHQLPIAFIHPWSTQHGLPMVVHCERDTEQLVFGALLRPPLAAWNITKDNDITTNNIFERPLGSPFWTAGDQRGKEKALPDAILVSEWKSHTDRKVPLVVEVKCDNVLRVPRETIVEVEVEDPPPIPGRPTTRSMTNRREYMACRAWVSIWEDLIPTNLERYPLGYAMPFC